MSTNATPTGAASLSAVLTRAEELGYDAQLIAREDARLECGACDALSDPAEVTVEHAHRLEGASDAADMLLVVGAVCPSCGRRGVATLGYGPNSSRTDNEVLLALDVEAAGPFPSGDD